MQSQAGQLVLGDLGRGLQQKLLLWGLSRFSSERWSLSCPWEHSGLLLSAHSPTFSLLSSDTNTVVGLPRPIHESIRTLKQVSLLLSSSSCPSLSVSAGSPPQQE